MASSSSAVQEAMTMPSNTSYLKLRFQAYRRFFFEEAQKREIQSRLPFTGTTLVWDTTSVSVSIRPELARIAELLYLTPETEASYETLAGKDCFQRLRTLSSLISEKSLLRDSATQTLFNHLNQRLSNDFQHLLNFFHYTNLTTYPKKEITLDAIGEMFNSQPLKYLDESVKDIDSRGDIRGLANYSLSLTLPDVDTIRSSLNSNKPDEIPSFSLVTYRCQLPSPTILGPTTFGSLKLLQDIHSISPYDTRVTPHLVDRYSTANGLRYHLYQPFFEFLKLIFGFDVVSDLRKHLTIEAFDKTPIDRNPSTLVAIIVLGIYNHSTANLISKINRLTLDMTRRSTQLAYGFYGALSRDIAGFDNIINALHYMYLNRNENNIYFTWPNNMDAIDALLAIEGVDVNQADHYRMTPLKLVIKDLCGHDLYPTPVPAIPVDDMYFDKLAAYAITLINIHGATLTLTAKESTTLIKHVNDAIQTGNLPRVTTLCSLHSPVINGWFEQADSASRCGLVEKPQILELLLPHATSLTLLDKASMLGQAIIQNDTESTAYLLSTCFPADHQATTREELAASIALIENEVGKLTDSLNTSIPETAKAEINKALIEKQAILTAQKHALEKLAVFLDEGVSQTTTTTCMTTSSPACSSSVTDTTGTRSTGTSTTVSSSTTTSGPSQFFPACPGTQIRSQEVSTKTLKF